MEAFVNSDVLGTGVLVLVLGIIMSLGLMYLPSRVLAALPLLEVNRIVLKLFFWLSLLIFLLFELVFSAAFLGIDIVTSQSSFPFTKFYGIFEPASGIGGWETWATISFIIFLIVIISIVIFLVVMAPFLVVKFTISRRFKLTAFQIVMPRVTSYGKAEIKSLGAGEMIPKPFIKGFVAANAPCRDFAKSANTPEQRRMRKYQYTTVNQDALRIEQDGWTVDVWESVHSFKGQVFCPDADDGKSWRNSVMETCFNGVCLRFNEALAAVSEPVLIPVCPSDVIATYAPSKKDRVGGIVGLLRSVWMDFSGNILTEGPGDDTLKDLACETPLEHQFTDLVPNVAFVGAAGRDLYVFIETDLEGHLFEFQMNKSASWNIQMFQQDLQFISNQITLVQKELIPAVQGYFAAPALHAS